MILTGISTTSTNLIFATCCCELEVFLQSEPGDGNRNILQMILDPGTSGNASEITEIINSPYTPPVGVPPLPIGLGVPGSIPIKIKFCAPAKIGQTDVLTLRVLWQRGNNPPQTTDFLISLQTVNQFLYFSPPIGPVNFGNVPVGSSASTSFTFTNPTICPAEVNITQQPINGSGCSDITINQPNPFVVPSGGNANIQITWNPSVSGDMGCAVSLNICEYGPTIRLTGLAIALSNCLSCLNVWFRTENDFLPAAPGLCNDYPTDGRFDRASVGEKKKVVFNFYYATGLSNGVELWFNPELFGDVLNFAAYYPGTIIDGPPPVAYYIQFFTGIGSASMTLIGAGANANNNRNFNVVFVEGSTPEEFSIEFEFFFTFDVNTWIDGTSKINNQRLLKNSVLAGPILTNTIPAVYNQVRKANFFFFVRDPSILVLDPLTGANVPFTCYEEKSIKTTARFYNSGLLGGPTEFSNPSIQLIRGGSPVTNFSSFSNTEVTFTVDAPSGPPGSALDSCVFWLFDANGFDNATDFVQNYDTSRAQILTGAGALDNHLTGPSVAPTLVSGSTYEVKANVANSVVPGQSFYLAAICYSTAANVPNTFLFGPFEVTDQPGLEDVCCDLQTRHLFGNYNATAGADCYLPTVKERITSQFRIKGGDFKDVCLLNLGLPAPKVNDWVNFVTAIELLIYREIVDYPTTGQTTTFLFGKYRSERNVAFPSNWNNLNAPFTVQDGGAGQLPEPEILCNFNTRVRYETNLLPSTVLVANNATPYTRTSAGPLASTYISANNVDFNWANQDVFFEYRVEFDVSLLVGSPYQITHVKRAKIRPFDFEANRGFVGLDDIDFFFADPENPKVPGQQVFGPFCPGSAPFGLLLVRTRQTTLQGMNLIATLDPFPFGSIYIREEESYSSPASIPLPLLTAAEIDGVDQVFGPDQYAWFRIDLTQLTAGSYQICSIGIVK